MSTLPPPLNFALVGCGAIATTQANALRELPALVCLSHCVDEDPAKAAAFAAKYKLSVASWVAVLANPHIDAIALCVPSGLHTCMGAEALRAGKHVIIEKPMAASVSGCDELIAAQQASGRQLAIICQHRFDPASQAIHALLQKNALGRLIAAEVRIAWFRTQEYYDSGAGRGTWAMDGGGCLMTQGIHTLDLLLWFCGPVREVSARVATAAHQRIEVEDLVCATLTFANGALGTLFASTATYPGFPARLALHGTEGTAVLEGDELHVLALKGQPVVKGPPASAQSVQVATGGTRLATQETAASSTDSAWKWGDAHREQFADFIAAIHENRPPLVDGDAGRAAVALIQAIYQSSRSGLSVRL
ncbi:MAG: Gfo/Idh/MocA family oxidoreductase [Verrucomicrobia bacterium]|nr:Gfo/Idh/MocA family oxidoreductase [Verrucomicrobiota bacterium]